MEVAPTLQLTTTKLATYVRFIHKTTAFTFRLLQSTNELVHEYLNQLPGSLGLAGLAHAATACTGVARIVGADDREYCCNL